MHYSLQLMVTSLVELARLIGLEIQGLNSEPSGVQLMSRFLAQTEDALRKIAFCQPMEKNGTRGGGFRNG